MIDFSLKCMHIFGILSKFDFKIVTASTTREVKSNISKTKENPMKLQKNRKGSDHIHNTVYSKMKLL